MVAASDAEPLPSQLRSGLPRAGVSWCCNLRFSCLHLVLWTELQTCAQLSCLKHRSHVGRWLPPRLSSRSEDLLCFNPPCKKATVRRRCPRGALRSRPGQENPRCILLPVMRSPRGISCKVKCCSLSCQAPGQLVIYKTICPRVLQTEEPFSHRIVLSRAPLLETGCCTPRCLQMGSSGGLENPVSSL